MPKITSDKDVRRLIDLARSEKWTVELTSGQHVRFVPPKKDKPIVVHSLTSSDWRGYANLKSQLRRSGLNV